MKLSFSIKFPNGKPTYFIDKIWDCLVKSWLITGDLRADYLISYRNKFNSNWDSIEGIKPKRHTIRKDEKNRWKAGMNIHFVINNRSKNEFRFAPVVDCRSVQKIEIEYLIDLEIFKSSPLLPRPISVEVDERTLDANEIQTLAQNDGFDSVEDFFEWFNTDFTGKIIHWTDLKY